MTQVIRPREVYRLLGVSPQTVWRWRRDGQFPQPIPLGANSVGYLRSELDAWLEARATARDAKLGHQGGRQP